MGWREGAGCGPLLVRADGGSGIGLGHLMRCTSIAREAADMGCTVLFAVSGEETAGIVRSLGFGARVVGGDLRALAEADALALDRLAAEVGACGVLVDTYAATPGFLSAAQGSLSSAGTTLAYVDDLYRHDSGFLEQPARYDVDVVVNYSFGADLVAYEDCYAGCATRLLVGPGFAPVRAEFKGAERPVGDRVGRILVTSGSTNPGGALERMVRGCMQVASGTAVDVVVGAQADFDAEQFRAQPIAVHRGLTDLSPLMADADVAVSAAGSTLYELCCMGVLTAAFPVVENQVANARGFIGRGLGTGSETTEWSQADVAGAVWYLAQSPERRRKLSDQMRAVVDGYGARRIAEALYEEILNA